MHSDDKQRVRYAHFTALLFVQLVEKVQNNYLLVYPVYISCFDLVIPTLNRLLSLKEYILWTYKTYMMYLQMVNTRRSNQGGDDLPPPPPVTLEQLMMMQIQLLQQMAQNMQNHRNGNAPPQVRDKRGEFLKGHPPVFKHSTDPLQADDWLCAVERQLEIAQYADKEKVLYAAGQL